MSIQTDFPITNEEFSVLDKKFGKLCHHAAWELIRNNSNNNHDYEQEDVAQELKCSLMDAGSYYKRQIFIEECLRLCKKYAKDKFLKLLVKELQFLWENKTRHGACRQKFGSHQETILNTLLNNLVPVEKQPDKNNSLKVDAKFTRYCKSIAWNRQRAIGRKISKLKTVFDGLVSLSTYEHVSGLAVDRRCH